MFEHMAFKGTDTIGTRDYERRRRCSRRWTQAYAASTRAPRGRPGRRAKSAKLEKAWRDAIAEADPFIVKNEFGEIVDRKGGTA